MQVYYGNGAGGFLRRGGAGSAGARPQGLAIADFNHDGNLDIVVAHESSAGLVLFTGTASGGLTPRPIGGEPNLNVVAAGDFNRDGWMDVAAASTSGNRVAVYLATASTLRLARTYPVGASPRGIVAEDVNYDGRLDLVTANRTTGTVSLLLGNASSPGSFGDARISPPAAAAARWSRPISIAMAASTSPPATRTHRPQACCGTTRHSSAQDSRSSVCRSTPSTSMGGSNQAWPADFNEDGKLDVLTEADYRLGAQLHVLITGGPTVRSLTTRTYGAGPSRTSTTISTPT